MQQILNTQNSLKENVAECWGFECLYFGTEAWERWLKADQRNHFLHFRREGKFTVPTRTLEKFKNFIDFKDATDHCGIVQAKWRQAIDSGRVLQGSIGGKVSTSTTTSSARTAPAKTPPSPSSFVLQASTGEKLSLTQARLEPGKIVVARAGNKEKGTAVAITEAPAVFLPEIVRMARDIAMEGNKTALAEKLDPATWFKGFTRITFLGRELKEGDYLHLEMAKLLKIIESEMVKKFGGDAKSVGDLLLNKSNEAISGSRLVSATAIFSMHMFGLAVDVNYRGNPFIQLGAISALNTVLKNAGLLMNQPTTLAYKHGQGFDSVQQADTILERYFSLLDSPSAELQRLTQTSSSEWRDLSAADAKAKIQKDLDHLAPLLSRGGKMKDYFKRHAILDFDKRFVVQMEELGLSWGGHYGDMMHFDMRRTGVGLYIQEARLAYAKKARDFARRLLKEKTYGTHPLTAPPPAVFTVQQPPPRTEEGAEQSTVRTPLATGGFSFLLAGPIVRRATPERVWFWFACSQEPKGCQPSIIPYDEKGRVWQHLVDPTFKEIVLRVEEDRVARLGKNVWVVLCSAVPKSGKFPTDIILGYDLTIHTAGNGKIKLSDLALNITYAPFPRPTFVIGELNRHVAHGSCRRPGAPGEDASRVFDEWLTKTATDSYKRPANLILTGDQIYADDVAVPLFEAVHKIAKDVFGYVEQIPNKTGTGLASVDSYSWKNIGPYMWSGRRYLTHRVTSPIGFTTDDGEAHLLSFPEYAAMYLAVWNPEICARYRVDDGTDNNLRGFEKAVSAFRRITANTATYMLCDDHEITDDWNLDQAWEDATKKNAMARRIIANGLAAYWGFQAWGNEPDDFDASFVDTIKRHLDQLRAGNGTPSQAATGYDQTLLDRHWSFMAASNPKALCVDTRTRRETPKGKTAILSGKRVWPFMEKLLRSSGFRKGEMLLLVLPTPFLPHRSMLYIQSKEYKWPGQRYEGDFELYGNNPQQRGELILWLQRNFGPSAVVIFSGDVHHGSVVTGRYGYGPSLDKIKRGKADWAMRIVQVTSSPIKNVKTAAYVDKSWVGLWQTDAGNVGESLIPQWETQYATLDRNAFIAMQAFTRYLGGELGRRTYVFENHFCVVDMPSRLGGFVHVLFTGVKDGKLATASISVDTDNDPSKFQITQISGRELPKGVFFPAFEGVTDASDFVELADQIVDEETSRTSPDTILHEMLSQAGDTEALADFENGLLPDAAEVFDSIAYHPGGRRHGQLTQSLQVVALPGARLDRELRRGDVMVRRGEGQLAHVSVIAEPRLRNLENLLSEGLTPESYSAGNYAQVVEAGARPHTSADGFARQMTDSAGRVLNDILPLRRLEREVAEDAVLDEWTFW